MHESSGYQDAGAKVLAQEDNVVGSAALGHSLRREEGETACDGAEEEDQEQGEDVKRRIVGASILRPAGWFLAAAAITAIPVLLSLREFGQQHIRWDGRPGYI